MNVHQRMSFDERDAARKHDQKIGRWMPVYILAILAVTMIALGGCAAVPEFAHECANLYELDENIRSCEIKSERNAVRRQENLEYKQEERRLMQVCQDAKLMFYCATRGPGKPRLDRDCGCMSRGQFRNLIEGAF